MRTDGFCCPACRGPIAVVGETLCCRACRLVYPIVDGIPVLIPARAGPMESS